MQNLPKILTRREAAQTLGIAQRTFDSLVNSGQGPASIALSARRVGFLLPDLEAWLAARRRTTGEG